MLARSAATAVAAARQRATAGRALLHQSSRALAEEAQGGVPSKLTLTFATPHEPVCVERKVDVVVIPGVVGTYGVTPGHTPLVAELKPGVVEIYDDANGEAEKYFVNAGFAVTDETSRTRAFMMVPCFISPVAPAPRSPPDAQQHFFFLHR